MRQRLFSPMLFNAIDWMEVDRFDQRTAALGDYIGDARVFGVRLWTVRNAAKPGGEIKVRRHAASLDPFKIADLAGEIDEILVLRRPLRTRPRQADGRARRDQKTRWAALTC